MLSIVVIEEMQREEERRKERERPSLRVPVEEYDLPPQPSEPEAVGKEEHGGRVVVLDMSQDDVEQFRIASW